LYKNFTLSPSLWLFCIFVYFFFSKYSAWKVLKLCLYKGRSVSWDEVLKYQLIFKSIKVISLFAYLGQLGVFYFLFINFSLHEFHFLSSIHSLHLYHLSSDPCQLVLELKRLLGVNFHQFS